MTSDVPSSLAGTEYEPPAPALPYLVVVCRMSMMLTDTAPTEAGVFSIPPITSNLSRAMRSHCASKQHEASDLGVGSLSNARAYPGFNPEPIRCRTRT